MSKIRNNRAVVIGLTGYTGSGCTKLANYLAFDFMRTVQEEIKADNFPVIAHLYGKLAELRRSLSSKSDLEQIGKERANLKNELEQRELLNVIRRNKQEIKKSFFKISFSSMIVYFLVRNISDVDENHAQLRGIISQGLATLSMSLSDARSLINLFDRAMRRKSLTRKNPEPIDLTKEDVGKICALFDNLHIIKDAIIAKHGRGVFQDFGDNLRKTGNPYKSKKDEAVKKGYLRARHLARIVDKYINFLQQYGEQHFFVIECFRNPQELFFFREKYSYFYLFAIDVEQDRRAAYLGEDFKNIDRREKNEDGGAKEFSKIDVARCMDSADVIIKNSSEDSAFYKKFLKYFALILEPGCIKPTHEETMMSMAYTIASRSNCTSRQVGAIITNSDGYIIGAGWNDVGEGQISCGQTAAQDYRNIPALHGEKMILDECDKADYVCYRSKLKSNITNEKNFSDCLALHAEENAILQLAKYHSGIPFESAMFTTTYPCSLCLKKISQVGISKVVYMQGYSNSLSKKILEEGSRIIEMESFEGVQYYSFFKLFKPYYDRKEQQQILKKEK